MGGNQQPRIGLSLKVAQRQILTPGLVQMVSVLALNKLELREMINQEIMSNPVLEELSETVPSIEESTQKTEGEKPVAPPADREIRSQDNHDSFEEIDFGSFFEDYLDPGYKSPAAEVLEKPSFENFLSQPVSLADHLTRQLSLSVCCDAVCEAGNSIIGNVNEDGYLSASPEEIAQTGGHRLEDVQRALTLIQEFDPLGVAARDLRECLLIQLRHLGAENGVAWKLVSDHMNLLQNRDLKGLAKALGRPVAHIERALEVIKRLDPRPGQRYSAEEARLIEPDVAFVK